MEKLLYQGSFFQQICYDNDENNHLGNARYFDLCEEVRADLLTGMGFSDRKFNLEGIAMRRKKYVDVNFHGDLREGDYFRVDLRFVQAGKVKFDMHFNFYNELGELVFEAHTKDTFVKLGSGKKPKPIEIPQFFIDSIGNL